jgi:hypothetical protein
MEGALLGLEARRRQLLTQPLCEPLELLGGLQPCPQDASPAAPGRAAQRQLEAADPTDSGRASTLDVGDELRVDPPEERHCEVPGARFGPLRVRCRALQVRDWLLHRGTDPWGDLHRDEQAHSRRRHRPYARAMSAAAPLVGAVAHCEAALEPVIERDWDKRVPGMTWTVRETVEQLMAGQGARPRSFEELLGEPGIFEDENIRVNPTAVRVPVFFSHSEAVHIETRDKITAKQARELLASAPGIEVLDTQEPGGYPTAVTEGANTDSVYVGRIREDISHPRGLDLWIVSDNVRKGAALNSIQIAEILVKDYL